MFLIARVFVEVPGELWRLVTVCYDGVPPFHSYCKPEWWVVPKVWP